MMTIKFNNKTVSVPYETFVQYLQYRKVTKQLEDSYSEALRYTQDNLIQNIIIWANNYAGLNTTFPKLEIELEKIANDLILGVN